MAQQVSFTPRRVITVPKDFKSQPPAVVYQNPTNVQKEPLWGRERTGTLAPPPLTVQPSSSSTGGLASSMFKTFQATSSNEDTPQNALQLKNLPDRANIPEMTPESVTPGGIENDSSRFWRPVVLRIYELYFKGRIGSLLSVLTILDGEHWKQLLDFTLGIISFLSKETTDDAPPPPMPAQLLVNLLIAHACTKALTPCTPSQVTTPLWYLHLMVLTRIFIPPSTSSQGTRSSEPSHVVKFTAKMMSSSAVAAFLFSWGFISHSKDSFTALQHAWCRHGGDILLTCQQALESLFPSKLSEHDKCEGREAMSHKEQPSFLVLATAVTCYFSAHLHTHGHAISKSKDEDGDKHEDEDADSPGPSAKTQDLFSHVMQQLLHLGNTCHGVERTSNRFLMCLRDVLGQFFGPAPPHEGELPDPVSPIQGPLDEVGTRADGRALARVIRALLAAHYANHATHPAMVEDAVASRTVSATSGLSSGTIIGPADAEDFVPIMEPGPLRRSLDFMEQSALLRLVQNKLCTAPFRDIAGANDQLELYALRAIRVLWFDLRRGTSTLKKESRAVEKGAVSAVLVLRHLRLRLVHEWEAKLATFPYIHLNGAGNVTVRGLAISVHFKLNRLNGADPFKVDVETPQLDVQLTCSSTLSQLVVSAMVAIVQKSLRDHIRNQLQHFLSQQLQHEACKLNSSVWKNLVKMTHEHLLESGIEWLESCIPPEGLPL